MSVMPIIVIQGLSLNTRITPGSSAQSIVWGKFLDSFEPWEIPLSTDAGNTASNLIVSGAGNKNPSAVRSVCFGGA